MRAELLTSIDALDDSIRSIGLMSCPDCSRTPSDSGNGTGLCRACGTILLSPDPGPNDVYRITLTLVSDPVAKIYRLIDKINDRYASIFTNGELTLASTSGRYSRYLHAASRAAGTFGRPGGNRPAPHAAVLIQAALPAWPACWKIAARGRTAAAGSSSAPAAGGRPASCAGCGGRPPRPTRGLMTSSSPR